MNIAWNSTKIDFVKGFESLSRTLFKVRQFLFGVKVVSLTVQ